MVIVPYVKTLQGPDTEAGSTEFQGYNLLAMIVSTFLKNILKYFFNILSIFFKYSKYFKNILKLSVS